MAVDKDTVAEIAWLARIRITEAESEALTGELSNILDWIEQLAPSILFNSSSVHAIEMSAHSPMTQAGNFVTTPVGAVSS